MAKTATISVTQEDINHGCKSSAANCPIARAMSRFFSMECYVTPTYWSTENDGFEVRRWLDAPKMQSKINSFDLYGDMNPFTFEVEIAD